jgi:exodeoxyribonuclease VII large subunit
MELIRIGRENTFRSGVVAANLMSRLNSSVKTFSSGWEKVIEISRQKLPAFTFNSLTNHKTRLTVLENTLNILEPENVLKRGYTITSFNGKIVKNSVQLKNGDIIDTRFTDGTVISKVVEAH